MSIQTMRTWKIGDVEITRIVEVNNWEDDITMLLPDATPQTVLAYPWLQPHYATPQGKMIISFQCFVMRTREHRIMLDTCIGSDRKREFDIFTNMRSDFLERPRARGLPAGRDRFRAVHASTFRSRRVEHATRRRQVGADVPERPLSIRAQGIRALDDAQGHARLPRSQSHVRRRAAGRRCRARRPD